MQQVGGSDWEPGHIPSQHGAQVGVGDRALLPEDLGAPSWLEPPPPRLQGLHSLRKATGHKLPLALLPSSCSTPNLVPPSSPSADLSGFTF